MRIGDLGIALKFFPLSYPIQKVLLSEKIFNFFPWSGGFNFLSGQGPNEMQLSKMCISLGEECITLGPKVSCDYALLSILYTLFLRHRKILNTTPWLFENKNLGDFLQT